MNEEILSGLKAAKERGVQLEEAAQSFINAGYNQSEVKEVLSFLSRGFSPLPTAPKESTVSLVPKEAPFASIQPGHQAPTQKPKTSKMTWIILILVALILLGVLIPLLLFKDQFLGVVDKIFP